jgi:hypothetical protein
MSYLSSKNTTTIILMILVISLLLYFFTDVKQINSSNNSNNSNNSNKSEETKTKELFYQDTTTTAAGTTTTAAGTTTTAAATTTTAAGTTTTAAGTTTTAAGTTTTKKSTSTCDNLDSNISDANSNLKTGIDFVNDKYGSGAVSFSQCDYLEENDLLELIYANEMKIAGMSLNDIKLNVEHDSLIEEFYKSSDLTLVKNLRNTFKEVIKRLVNDSTVPNTINSLMDEAKIVLDKGNTTEKINEETTKAIITYLKEYIKTRASTFTDAERVPMKSNCENVPSFLKNMPKCKQYAYVIGLEKNVNNLNCRKCNYCDSDNNFLNYKEQLKKMDAGTCLDPCNKQPTLEVPASCSGGMSQSGYKSRSSAGSSSGSSSGSRTSSRTSSGSSRYGGTSRSNTGNNNARSAMSAYANNNNLGDLFNIEDIGRSLNEGAGEVMSRLGYAGYDPALKGSPRPRTYDNTIDYRVLNQGLANMNRGGGGGGGSGDASYSAPVVIQEDIDGVSNVFAPYIIFHNADSQPAFSSGNLNTNNGVQSQNIRGNSNSNGSNIDGLPIEEYLKSVM